MPGKSEAGFTLVEVLVEIVLGLCMIMGFIFISNQASLILSRSRSARGLADVVSSNLIEVKSRDASSLPGIGQCLIRKYDQFGNFVSESTTTISDSSCGQSSVERGTMEIDWKVRGPGDFDATFAPGAFLKFPKYKPSSLREVQILGRMQAATLIHFGATIYRK